MVRNERPARTPADAQSRRSEEASNSSLAHPVLVSDDEQINSDAETDAGETASLQLSRQVAKTRFAELCACAVACYVDQRKPTLSPSASALAADALRRYDTRMLTPTGVVSRNAAQTMGVMERYVQQRNRARGYKKGNPNIFTMMDFVREGSDFLVPDVFSQEYYDMLATQLTSKQQITVSGRAPKSKQKQASMVLSIPDSPTTEDELGDANVDAAGSPLYIERATAPSFSPSSAEIPVTTRPGVGSGLTESTTAQSEVSSILTTKAHTIEHPPSLGATYGRKRQGSGDLEPPRAAKEQRSGDLSGQNDARPPIRNATYVPFDDTEFSLEEKKLSSQMHDLFVSVKSTVYEGLEEMGVKDSTPALWSFSVSPVDILPKLYSTLLGPGMVNERRALIADTMSVADLTIALIGAFFKLEVFDLNTLPTAEKWLSSVTGTVGELAPFVDRELSRRLNTNIDTILRRAYFAWTKTSDFQEQKLASLADRLALTLASVLHDHLHQRPEDAVADRRDVQGSVINWARRLEDVIVRGLALQCQLSSARENCHFRWHIANEGVDQRSVQGTHGQGNKVVATMFPGLEFEAGNRTRTVYKTQAYLV